MCFLPLTPPTAHTYVSSSPTLMTQSFLFLHPSKLVRLSPSSILSVSRMTLPLETHPLSKGICKKKVCHPFEQFLCGSPSRQRNNKEQESTWTRMYHAAKKEKRYFWGSPWQRNALLLQQQKKKRIKKREKIKSPPTINTKQSILDHNQKRKKKPVCPIVFLFVEGYSNLGLVDR